MPGRSSEAAWQSTGRAGGTLGPRGARTRRRSRPSVPDPGDRGVPREVQPVPGARPRADRH
eukprot:1657728-Lingulodinium_polyedra.AAC.1